MASTTGFVREVIFLISSAGMSFSILDIGSPRRKSGLSEPYADMAASYVILGIGEGSLMPSNSTQSLAISVSTHPMTSDPLAKDISKSNYHHTISSVRSPPNYGRQAYLSELGLSVRS